MSSQIDNSDSHQDLPLSPDELFGLTMVEWHNIDKARGKAPTKMLQEYRALLDKGANPNTIVLGYHVPYDSLNRHRAFTHGPSVIPAHLLLSSEFSSPFLEWRRERTRHSSQDRDSPELKQLERMEAMVRKSPDLTRHLYHVFHALSDAACSLNHKRIAMLMEFGANFRDQLCELSDPLMVLLPNPLLPAIRARDEDLVRTLISLATPSHNLTLLWAGQCLVDLMEGVGDRSPVQLRIGDMLLKYGAVIPSLHILGDRARSYVRLWLEYPIAAGDHKRSQLQIATGDIVANKVQHLINQKIDINTRDVLGMSPLLEAVYYGHLEAVRILVSHGADVQQRAGEKVATLRKSILKGNLEAKGRFHYDRRLLDIEAYVHDRWPALHIAAQRGFSNISKILLLKGADKAVRDRAGRTALDVAVQCSNFDTAFVIISLTSSLEADLDSRSRLMALALNDMRLDAIKIMIDNGVPLSVNEGLDEAIRAKVQQSVIAAPTHLTEGPQPSLWGAEEGYLSNSASLYDWHMIFQSLASLEDQDSGSHAATALSKLWIEKCIKTHSQCNNQSTKQYSPTRLISISDESLKLVQDETICAPYVALTHRWGSGNLPRTLSTNIGRRMKSMILDELTQTMQDAFSMTRRLGYEYIWIDALCIIQDSEEDWLREAARMSDVFSGGVVTIAVADAEDHSQGMFRPRPGRCMRPFAIPFLERTPYRERVDFQGEGEFYVFPNTSRVSAGPRQKGTLDTRGWILQEQVLSRRTLYFGAGEIFWDCNTVSASESSPIATSLLQDENPDETWAFKTIRRTISKAANVNILKQKLADVWMELIKNYSSRQLTHQGDRLVALQGILRPLSHLLHEEPVAGMWRSQLWRQLLWWISKQTVSGPSSVESGFPAPSWSWLCARGPITYHNSLATQRKKQKTDGRTVTSSNFTDLDPHITIDSVDSQTLPDGRGVTGSMVVCGPSFQYRLTVNDLKKSGVKRFNASDWNLNSGNWLLDHPVQLPLSLTCIVVAEDSVAKVLYVGKAAEETTFSII
ncbi:hypothetical protein IQ06DRAFT_345279 [Phaeosphaeriaceae sp. SRC1lsM3a]|nr:hypothetical protein IQ06DRAFT_345279 [Stagonospora sp. SRC1lsM3a]